MDRGRIVVVSAGFALWKEGKCIAAAKWGDLRRLVAHRSVANGATTARLVVELADGTQLEMFEEAPGFDLFMHRASAVLPGLPTFTSWHQALMLAPEGADPVMLFERLAPKQRRPLSL